MQPRARGEVEAVLSTRALEVVRRGEFEAMSEMQAERGEPTWRRPIHSSGFSSMQEDNTRYRLQQAS